MVSQLNGAKATWRADIQGLRALAVLAVCAYHFDLRFSHGYLGVDVFMVVSGYVMTSLVVREWYQSGQRFSLFRFLTRRARRLIPALTFVVSGTGILYLVLAPSTYFRNVLVQGFMSLLSVSNLYFLRRSQGYFEIEPSGDPLLHTWSLGVEEQFYLMMGAFVVLIPSLALRNNKVRLGSLTIISLRIACITSVLVYWLLVSDRVTIAQQIYQRLPESLGFFFRPDSAYFYSPFARAWQFALGAICFLSQSNRVIMLHSIRSELAVFSVLIASLSGYLTFGNFDGIEIDRFWVSILTVVSLTRVNGHVLNSRLLVWIGDRSYSIYLWHFPLLSASRLVPGIPMRKGFLLGLTLMLAEFTFRFVEAPYLKRKESTSVFRRRTKRLMNSREVRVAVFGVVALLIAGLSIHFRLDLAVHGETTLSPRNHVEELQGWLRNEGCLSSDDGLVSCGSLNDSEIVLVGDSHAGSLAPGFIEAMRSLGISGSVRSQAGCHLAGGAYESPDTQCGSFYRSLRTELASSSAKAVMLVSCPRYLEGCPEGIRSNLLNRITHETELAVLDVVPQSMTVLLPGPLPLLLIDPSSQTQSLLQRLIPNSYRRLPLDTKRMRLSLRYQADLAAGLSASGYNVASSNIFRASCSDTSCASRISEYDDPVFRDSNHFTVAGAIQRSPSIARWLSEVWD